MSAGRLYFFFSVVERMCSCCVEVCLFHSLRVFPFIFYFLCTFLRFTLAAWAPLYGVFYAMQAPTLSHNIRLMLALLNAAAMSTFENFTVCEQYVRTKVGCNLDPDLTAYSNVAPFVFVSVYFFIFLFSIF